LRHDRSEWALIAACAKPSKPPTAPRDQHEPQGSLMTTGRQGWLLLILGVVFGAMIGEWLLR
jgi:hypothetical protein